MNGRLYKLFRMEDQVNLFCTFKCLYCRVPSRSKCVPVLRDGSATGSSCAKGQVDILYAHMASVFLQCFLIERFRS